MAKRVSLLMVYTGDGKGKTSAAMGLALRCYGHGGHCAVAQFIKAPEVETGERRAAVSLGMEWRNFGSGFTWMQADDTANREACRLGWETAKEWMQSGRFDMVVLDEFTYPLSLGYLEVSAVCLWLADHKGLEHFPHVVVTGRNAPVPLLAVADLVSEIVEVKHHWRTARTKAQAMVEY
jgi:cob(I)alamin adenosyltransferase